MKESYHQATRYLRTQGNSGSLTRVWSYDSWSGGSMTRTKSDWERGEWARPTSEVESLLLLQPIYSRFGTRGAVNMVAWRAWDSSWTREHQWPLSRWSCKLSSSINLPFWGLYIWRRLADLHIFQPRCLDIVKLESSSAVSLSLPFKLVRVGFCWLKLNYPSCYRSLYELANCKIDRCPRSKFDYLGALEPWNYSSSLSCCLNTAKHSCMLRLLGNGNVWVVYVGRFTAGWRYRWLTCHDTYPCQKSLLSFLSQYDLCQWKEGSGSWHSEQPAKFRLWLAMWPRESHFIPLQLPHL